METKDDRIKQFNNAKKKVRNLKVFYIHLIGYVILVALLSYNLYILGEGPYKTGITWLNVSTIVGWSIFIFLHGLKVFKGRLFFKKSWEDKKIEEYIKKSEKENSSFWE